MFVIPIQGSKAFLFKVPKLVRRQVPIRVDERGQNCCGAGQRVRQKRWKTEIQQNDHMTKTKRQEQNGTDIKTMEGRTPQMGNDELEETTLENKKD